MKYFKHICKPFLTKEKAIIVFIIFLLLNLSLFVVYKNSLYSREGYNTVYPNAGIELFYYIHIIGINPYHFICMLLLLPNIVSCDFLTMYLSHTHYSIELRISKKTYYILTFLINIVMTFLIVLLLELAILLIIHLFYSPIIFNTTEYPQYYHAITSLIFTDEIKNLIAFLLMTSFGYGLVSALLFSIQYFITNPYVYRCSGVIIGILLVLLPALIQGYFPNPDNIFILQINNLVCLGLEGVRDNPFHLDHSLVYILSALIYMIVSYIGFSYMYKGRCQHD